jgi:hypothetical protein
MSFGGYISHRRDFCGLVLAAPMAADVVFSQSAG